MTQGLLQIALFCALLLAAMPLLGGYMARVFAGDAAFLAPVERRVHRLLRVDAAASMSWKAYARAVIVFSAVCWLALYLVLRTQGLHPFNPLGLRSGAWDLSFNTTSSFVTNTNWQYYAGALAQGCTRCCSSRCSPCSSAG